MYKHMRKKKGKKCVTIKEIEKKNINKKDQSKIMNQKFEDRLISSSFLFAVVLSGNGEVMVVAGARRLNT